MPQSWRPRTQSHASYYTGQAPGISRIAMARAHTNRGGDTTAAAMATSRHRTIARHNAACSNTTKAYCVMRFPPITLTQDSQELLRFVLDALDEELKEDMRAPPAPGCPPSAPWMTPMATSPPATRLREPVRSEMPEDKVGSARRASRGEKPSPHPACLSSRYCSILCEDRPSMKRFSSCSLRPLPLPPARSPTAAHRWTLPRAPVDRLWRLSLLPFPPIFPLFPLRARPTPALPPQPHRCKLPPRNRRRPLSAASFRGCSRACC